MFGALDIDGKPESGQRLPIGGEAIMGVRLKALVAAGVVLVASGVASTPAQAATLTDRVEKEFTFTPIGGGA